MFIVFTRFECGLACTFKCKLQLIPLPVPGYRAADCNMSVRSYSQHRIVEHWKGLVESEGKFRWRSLTGWNRKQGDDAETYSNSETSENGL
jgi:hypothetical protein